MFLADLELTELRIPGVLQRLALTYFLTALPEVLFARLADQVRNTGKHVYHLYKILYTHMLIYI